MENIKGNQLEMKKTIFEMKSALERINRVDEAENRITYIEDRGNGRHPIRTATRKRIQKNEDSLRSLWDKIKRNNIRNIGAPEGGREQEIENLFEEITTESFPNLVKEIDIQPQEAQIVPNKMNQKRPTPRNIIIKMPMVKHKERILKAARGKRFLKRNFANQKGLAQNIQSGENPGPTIKIIQPSKAII